MEQTIHTVSVLSCISPLMNLHPENTEAQRHVRYLESPR